MKPIRHLLENRSVFSVERSMTVRDAAGYMAVKNIGAVSVMEKERLVGIFSERDIIARVIARGLDPSSVLVGDVMTHDLVVGDADDTYETCLKKMKVANCRHLPIVRGDVLLGVISLRDLLQVDIDEKDDKIEFLTDYMFHVSPESSKKYKS